MKKLLQTEGAEDVRGRRGESQSVCHRGIILMAPKTRRPGAGVEGKMTMSRADRKKPVRSSEISSTPSSVEVQITNKCIFLHNLKNKQCTLWIHLWLQIAVKTGWMELKINEGKFSDFRNFQKSERGEAASGCFIHMVHGLSAQTRGCWAHWLRVFFMLFQNWTLSVLWRCPPGKF